MAQAGVRLTKLYWNRSRSAVFLLLLFFQKTAFLFFGVMLSVPLFVLAAVSVMQAHAQTTSAYVSSSASEQPDLPDAPLPSPTPAQGAQPNIPFLSPGFRGPLQPMDFGAKFKYLVEPAFGPRSFVTNAIGSGIRMANPPAGYPHEWRAGAEAFGHNYGDSYARAGAESLARFSTSVLMHEDPRYQHADSTFFPARLGHAVVFTFVDRTDGGHRTIAMSNFTGAAAGGFVGNAYLPAGFDNLTHAGQRSAIAFGGIAAQNVLQEFSPEIGLFLKKIHLPHIPLPPVWWTGNQ